jgi:hypothetical protein
MPSDKFLVTIGGSIDPITVTIEQCAQLTGESRSQVYVRIGRNQYEAVKSGSRTLIIFESIRRHFAALPRARIKPPKPRKRNPLGTPPGA